MPRAIQFLSTTPTLSNNGNITATGNSSNNIDIQSNGAGNVLNVAMGAGSSMFVTNGSLTFNGSGSGAITVTGGPANGTINSATGPISFNGGANPVSVNVYQISNAGGPLTGSGSSINITAANGNMSLGLLTSSGATTVINNDNTAGHGGISVVCAMAFTGFSVSLTGGALGTISISAAGSITTSPGGTDITLANINIVTNAGSVTSESRSYFNGSKHS